jgi:hypothetical protein
MIKASNRSELSQIPKICLRWDPTRGSGQEREPNRYPPDAVILGFREFTTSFFWEAHEFCIGSSVHRDWAWTRRERLCGLGYHEDADNLFRLIRYPAVERPVIKAGITARTTAHTDFGSITILFQDDVGGLEVEDPAKPGTYSALSSSMLFKESADHSISSCCHAGGSSVIVNVGDFLIRW